MGLWYSVICYFTPNQTLHRAHTITYWYILSNTVWHHNMYNLLFNIVIQVVIKYGIYLYLKIKYTIYIVCYILKNILYLQPCSCRLCRRCRSSTRRPPCPSAAVPTAGAGSAGALLLLLRLRLSHGRRCRCSLQA